MRNIKRPQTFFSICMDSHRAPFSFNRCQCHDEGRADGGLFYLLNNVLKANIMIKRWSKILYRCLPTFLACRHWVKSVNPCEICVLFTGNPNRCVLYKAAVNRSGILFTSEGCKGGYPHSSVSTYFKTVRQFIETYNQINTGPLDSR